jgi:uncharacterized repeat protein (TIGR02543 family)
MLGIIGCSALAASPASAGIATVQTPISVDANPVGVTFNPAGTQGWITISSSDELEVVQRSTGVVTTETLPTCSGPMSLAFTPDGLKAYVACYNSNSVVEFSPSDPVASDKTITVGTAPFFVAMSPDGSKLYVPNSGGATGTVSVIDTSTDTVTATIPVGLAPVAVAFNPSGTKAYVAAGTQAAGGNVVTMIDVATSTVPAGTVALPNPISVTGVPYGLAVSPDGNSLWVSRDNGLKASIISTATNTISKTFTLTGKPEGVTFSPDGRRVYIPMQSGGVAVFDASSQTQLPYLASGSGSRIMAFTPDGTLAYVSNTTGSSVSVYSFDNALPTISGVPSAGTEGTPYSFTPTVTGTAVTVSVKSGPLPPGLSLNSGVISGTPTSNGDYPVTLAAINDNGEADLSISFSISLPSYTVSFDSAGGGPTPISQSVTEGGLVTQPADPTLSGYAFEGWANAGVPWDFATDTVSGALTLTAQWGLLPTITGASTATAPVSASFTWTPTITAAPGYVVTSSALPAGLSLDSATGVISGTPSGVPGDTTVDLTVTDSVGTADFTVVITVTHGEAQTLGVTASDTTPKQGDTITLTVIATDADGNTWDVSSSAVITSDFASDIIVGNSVTFPHASPHLLTATFDGLTATVLVTVTPTAVVLGVTGGGLADWLVPWGLAAVTAGVGLMAFRLRRRCVLWLRGTDATR